MRGYFFILHFIGQRGNSFCLSVTEFIPSIKMQKRVLIIDDEVDLCLLVRKHLNNKGHIVYVAHTLEDGMKKLSSLVPDTLILDNHLPDGLGWTMVDKLHSQYPDMHITLISAYGTPKELLFPEDMDITILDKPLSIADIDATLA